MSGVFVWFCDAVEFVGLIAFAASGAMLAIDRDLDLFGVLFLGIVSSVGGGMLRDVLLGILPPQAFSNSRYIIIAFCTALAVFLFAYLRGGRYWARRESMDRAINLLDAVGLGLFTVVGVQMAMKEGYSDNAFLCLFMGMTTAIGGGVLRDMLSMTVPVVLKKRIYALASIAGAAIYYILVQMEANGPTSILVAMSVTVMIRMLSTRFTWDLPRVPRP